jgi:phenylalanyl-tRNA synthetase beta chain
MLLPLNWLREYVRMDLQPQAYADKMVGVGFEIAGIHRLYEEISGVVAGRVLTLEKHPDADKLFVCSIDAGGEQPLQIVTGAQNLFVGATVPVALCGAKLPGGIKIKKGKLRGVESFGMLCSGQELLLKEEDYEGAEVDGIMILREEYAPGTDIKQALSLEDTVFEFELTANRPDCMSVIGLARETAAALDEPISLPQLPEIEGEGDISDYVSVEVLDKDLCPRYIAGMAKNLKIGPSPVWMRRFLRAAGVRPINNIVDITNFVMLEYGQPMHAFDYEFLRGRKIVVRRAAEHETLVTLDDKPRELTEDMLVIADGEGSVGIAGVMGGQNSEVTEKTTAIVLESALFDAKSIRKTSRALGLSTEAAARFSKGLDMRRSMLALRRALQLIRELGAGEVVGGCIDVGGELPPNKTLRVSPERINALLGLELTPDAMAAILGRLDIRAQVSGGSLICEIPSFRMDIEGEADIAEEIGRIHGYEHVPMTMMRGGLLRGKKSPWQKAREDMKNLLCAYGAYETYTYSFTGPAMLDALRLPEDSSLRKCVRIMNPFGEDQSLMRSSVAPSMLKVVADNQSVKTPAGRFFEMTRVFEDTGEQLPKETELLCIAAYGKDEDFFSMKGMVEGLLDGFGIEARCEGGELTALPYYHPGRAARITLLKDSGVTLGYFGEIHPETAEKMGVSGRVYLAEIYPRTLFDYMQRDRTYVPLPKYPGIERDLAVVVDDSVKNGDLVDAIQKAGGKLLETVLLFDVYTGEKIGAGKKSLAYSLVFRSSERTLSDEDIAGEMQSILDTLEAKYGAKLRS